MSTMLYIKASPRGARSWSLRAAEALVGEYRRLHPDAEVRTLDVFAESLPEFAGAALDAKYAVMRGASPTASQARAWDAIVQLIDDFKNADCYVMAVPMWNFGIPYRLKQYFDLLVQPGLTFSYDPGQGYRGLVQGRPICLVTASGGDYSAEGAQALDFHLRYLQTICGFIGFSDIRVLRVAPTLQGDDATLEQVGKNSLQEALKMAAAL